jgi:DNA helicase-2/ATP-dependent DNA helicase PcrA
MPGVLDADFPWTDEQRRVIQNHEGPLQVVACAGSGKTHTVSARIAQMVHDGVDRDKILAFTFGENAAEELKVRIREWMQRADLEDESLGEMFVNTIHSFCQKEILNEHREETLNHDVLNDNELAAFISKHINDLELWDLPRGHKYEKIEWFIEDVNTIRRELIVDDLAASNDDYAPELMEAYYAYRELMEEYHFYDYQELIYRAVQLLRRDPEVLAEVREQYEYIIVDEYQDVNPAQAELIDLISGDDPNLCVVGDDDQSIYGWRGARPEDFRAFNDRYGGDQEILSENHRCSEMIVDIAQEFVEQNDDRLDKPMESDNPFDVGDVYQHYFDHEHDEVAFIADRIEDLHGTVYENPSEEETTLRYGDVGILLRKKRHMQEIQRELDERGIPYTIRGRSSVFENPTAGLIRLAFAYVARGLEDNDDAYVYDPPLEIWDPDSKPPGSGDDEYFVVTEDLLRREIRANPDLRDREDEIIEKLDERQDWYRAPTSRRIEPQTELHEILRAFGIAELDGEDVDLNAEAFEESVMYNVGQISELVKDFESVYEIIFPDQLEELVDFLDYSYYNSRSEIEDPTLVDAVDLLTIHSVKGLQYPAVFMPGLTTQKFDFTPPRNFSRSQEWLPQDVFNYDDYQASTEEERRLLYVAMTRA